LKKIKNIILLISTVALIFSGYTVMKNYIHENIILNKIIARLEADSRIAEVLVTEVRYDEKEQKSFTTIKFLEYDNKGYPLYPKYFTFSGNIIQFQSLVIRFDEGFIRQADKMKGKSIYLFWKVFLLDGENTQEYPITKVNEIPQGYKLDKINDDFEDEFWEKFWEYSLDPDKSSSLGIKNAQIEAPGSLFIPGLLYTIRIEHDGGLRIDSSKISPILKGETIPP